MSDLRVKLHVLCITLLLGIVTMSAQEIRYVSKSGNNSNSGKGGWANAKADIQDAINDLVNNNLTGEVWVAAGTYYPTETIESSGSQYYKSFKIPAGITVRGGFRGIVDADVEKEIEGYAGEASTTDRVTVSDKNFGNGNKDGVPQTGKLDNEDGASGVYKYKTILCGDLVAGKEGKLTWNADKQQFDATYYGNSYHVVWFAMNGFASGRANPLAKPAKLEGCVVKGGHAYSKAATAAPHEGNGGGIYMVANSFVYNCEVRDCDASRNGGGIYMDGGGIVRRTLVHRCQALGVGTEYGYGGGICEVGAATNSKTNPIVVAQSVVTNCAGRMGGGMALLADESEGHNKYAIVANSTLVNNNTATMEAGGVYTYKGGGLASMTIVRNKCNGSGIIQNGQLTGRSGGVYSRDAAYIGNTVIWGNKCESNKDIQYADSHSSLTGTEKTKFYYSALSNADLADWSKSEKMGVLSLDDANTTVVANKGNKGYPLFENPSPTAGYIDNYFEAAYDWKVFSESALHHAGINTADLDYEDLTPAPQGISYDMQFGIFNARCTMGAIISEEPEIEANTETTGEAHFFIDPNYNFATHHDQDAKGKSWELPTRFLGNVLEYIKKNASTTLNGKKIFVHVKEGTVDNTDSFKSGRVRTTTLDIPGNVTILGSYDGRLQGTDLTKRNPVATPTVISGQLLDNYKYNIAHLINIEQAENVTFDGFQIRYANAATTELGNSNQDGAAITIKNSTGVSIKNIIVANCQAERGAAVLADASTATFENCIFHNNTLRTIANSGLIYGINGSSLRFDHCDVLRNVGHAAYLGSNNTTNVWTNSIFYANMDRDMADTNIDSANSDPSSPGLNLHALAAFSGNTANATGARCMFDAKSASFASQFGGNDTGNQWQYNLQYAFIEGSGQGYPRFINPTKNAGVTEDGDQTYYGRATSFEPHNNNPIVNLAADASLTEDIIGITRNYGGLPDIGAVENHAATEGENAYKDGQRAYGEVMYVRDYGADMSIDGRDGSSWERAINGNAMYEFAGTRNIEDTESRSVFKGYRIKSGTNQLIVKSGTLTRTTNNAVGTVFMLCDENGNELAEDADISTAKRLKDINTGNYLYLDYSSANYTFRTAANPTAAQALATFEKSGSNYKIKYTASNNQTRYIRNATAPASTTATSWTFEEIYMTEQVGLGTYTPTHYNYGSLKGLQYAVSKANIDYTDDPIRRSNPEKAKRQVWVGAGVYAKDPETGDHSCFIIKDGVDVYGAFPKTGNPGKDQRQALVSQYVLNDGSFNPQDYETILEPITKTVITGVTRRVLGQPKANNPKTWEDNPLLKADYEGATWDGFTIRFGCTDMEARNTWGGRDGGGGACLYNNVKLVNCVVTNNTSVRQTTSNDDATNLRAGGVYMDGGTMASCYIINNLLAGMNVTSLIKGNAAYGGGAYMYNGTMYNCVVANNRIYANYADGAGLYFENATFFNNTVVNNKAEGNKSEIGGIAIYTDLKKIEGDVSLFNIYNSIILNNSGYRGANGGHENVAMRTSTGKMYLHNCITSNCTNYDSGDKIISYDETCKALANNQVNTLLVDCPVAGYVDPTSSTGTFDSWNLRLNADSNLAINNGDDAPVLYGVTYDLSDYNDMDFTERIQDCRIDIGAYEFNGATAIAPNEVGDQAIYYVTPEGYGTTNANDPENAACASKLQRVLDAAGRYKYLNPTKQVIVKVANSYDLANPKDADTEPTNFTYYATRTTDWTDQDVRVWSIIVPRGVEVWGGYTDVASDFTKTSWSNSNNGFLTRDITKNPTYFDSYYVNKLEKTDAHTYHVVTFSDRIFDINGYAYTKEDFKNKNVEDIRTMIQNGTASAYVELIGNDESLFAHMTEAIDGVSAGVSGNVIMADADTPKNFGKADAPVYASNRAVLDGIFVSGGKADAASNSNNYAVNINSYGGAALVNEHAYVRNCILTGNSATNGGALALTDRAFVSGCLIVDNEAYNQGGGIYVFENGAKLSDGTTVNTAAGIGEQMDVNMPHVFTSTIVNNKAQQGGGIWFTDDVNSNARFNSLAVWQNEAADQDNVYGMVNPEQPTEDETLSEVFYPFSFSLIENVRASGSNNLEAMGLNREGVRFVNKYHDLGQATVDQYDLAVENEKAGENEYADFGFYGLTKYSTLCSNGMPKSMYDKLIERIGISEVDILNQPRKNEINNFVEIGARALPKLMPNKVLMLRLFVAHPDVVDTKTATQFMRLNEVDGELTPSQKYYSQMGSSFAYPFNFLQDAIDYITRARNGQIDGLKLMDGSDATSAIVRNLPFEIIVGKGTYYPKQGLNGQTESVWAQTFAIPEGVTIIGGFNPEGGVSVSDPTYYGRYYKADKTKAESTTAGDIYTNVNPIPTDDPEHRRTPGGNEVGRGNLFGDETVDLPKVGTAATAAIGTEGDPDYVPAKPASSDYMPARTVKFQQWHIQDIADRRGMADNNKNGIIEPWEFANQTIISGNAVNGETDGVYHVMTAVADADAVGNLPKIQKTCKQGTGIDFVGEDNVSQETGYQWHEEGQQIRLNGLIVTGGNALTYLSTALDDYGSYMFYHGAGLLVDGNRYKAVIDAPGAHTNPVFHNSAAYGLGYRDIPVSITNCQFRNNIAGYGGAISSNGSLSLFASSFEQNKALGQTEKPATGEHWYTNISGSKQEVSEVAYPGHGGAIHVTNQLSAFNTLFANNEACLAEDEPAERVTIDLVQHPTFRVPNKLEASATLRAAGGAIMMGSAAQHHIVNCDFVRNKANAYPAVFTMNPTTHQNDVVDTHSYSQIINTVAWGNEVNPEMLAKYSGNAAYQTASKLMVNIGRKNRDQGYVTSKSNRNFYNPSFTDGNVPSNTDLSVDNAETTATDSWQESVWFCAYEYGVGFKPNNTNDLREAIVYSAGRFAPTMIKEANKTVIGGDAELNTYYQNCNILIVADNDDVAGPNFGTPSVKAGFDGFMEGADWSPSRFNRLTDNGNGWITQNVETTATDINVTFPAATYSDGKPSNFQGAYPYTHYISDIVTGKFPEYKLWLSIGNEKYMEATNDPETRDLTINGTSIHRAQKNYPRISPDPTMGVDKAYIDIGVYEYQKQPLLKPGNEVDILWVSTKEKPENGPANGLTWRTPTSDLQKAIETLLTSRNGHKKEIRIMEGEYAPVTPQTITVANPDYNSEIPGAKPTIDVKFNAFVIDTKSLNEKIIAPSTFTGSNNEKFYAQSLTIKGGYSSDIMYEYDPVKYKTVIRQNESAEGNNTNYLFYVADPTVRYAFTSNTYPTNSSDGAVVVGTTGEAATAKTMPIQIDGVTLINNMAKAETAGSAIYYPDVTPTSSHSINVGADVVYYTDGKHTAKSDNGGKDETDYPSIEGGETMNNPAKIVITKAHVIGSGKPTTETEHDDPTKASAVYIGQNGGHSLIYNTVFHSNYGMPLNAYNTVNVNNTFGLNAGKVNLTGDASEMHNSALWKNNKTAEGYGDQFTGATSFTYNSYTGCPNDATNNNTSLADLNSNIGEGPNFIDPENADIEARSFDIKPSMRLLNQGSLTTLEGTYYDKIMHYDLGDSKYAPYDYALSSTTDVDAANRTRFKNNIDLGAYEFQGSLYGILYVDPNKPHNDDATGENWDKAFGYGDLQNAVDLAAIYHASTPTEEAYVFVKGNSSTNKKLNTNETVVVRDGVTTYGSVISGYTDWHNIPDPDDPSKPKYAKDNGAGGYVYDIDKFIEDMKSQREGIASDAASKTIVTGIKTDGDATYDAKTGQFPALVDGFVVTDPNPSKTPVLDVTNESKDAVIVVRNVIVADNNVTDGANVAQISNGLLYEALLRDNKTTGAALRVSNTETSKGYAVNVTVEGKTVDVDGKSLVDTDGGQIFKSITNSIHLGAAVATNNEAGKDAPYRKVANPGISGHYYNIADPNLNYQLTETSKYIDMCNATNPLTGVADNLAPYINYTTDRDLLGNPRWLKNVSNETSGYIDRGAFETWKVEKDFVCGKWTREGISYGTNKDAADPAIVHHFYPHDGSVVYVMEGRSLVIDPLGDDEIKPTPENPGFLLLKKGANFYGNGRPVTAAYVAVERDIRKGGTIMALPYRVNYDLRASVAKVGVDSNNNLSLDSRVGRAYSYSGNERMEWDYIFQNSDTRCWDQTSEAAANHGVLFEPHGQWYDASANDNDETLLRFTGKGNGIADYIYTESGYSKVVELINNDDTESSNNNADYTDEEDMGWNCIGIPYLVSEYKTYNTITPDVATHDYGLKQIPEDGLTGEALAVAKERNAIRAAIIDKYMLHTPKTLWLYYNGKVADYEENYQADGDGGYYSVRSWSHADNWHMAPIEPAVYADPTIWVGEGIFTQTATLDATEDLVFHLPVAPKEFTTTPPTTAKSSNRRYYYDGAADGIEEVEVSNVELIGIEYYTTDGVRIERPRRGAVTIIRRIYSNGSQQTSKQFVK